MIDKLTFKQPFTWPHGKESVFEAGLKIELEPGLNVLVGDQGSGKSTLIELIRTWIEPDKGVNDRLHKSLSRKDAREVLDIEGEGLDKVRLLACDFEKDASRTSSAFDWSGALDTVRFLLNGNRASHGEANKMALNMLLNDLMKEYQEKGGVGPTLVLLDEPDAALSIASIVSLHMMLRSLAKLGCQVILSAHNPFLLGCFKSLYSLEYKKRITYGDYLALQVVSEKNPTAGVLFLNHYQTFDQALTERAKDDPAEPAKKQKAKRKKKTAKKSKKT